MLKHVAIALAALFVMAVSELGSADQAAADTGLVVVGDAINAPLQGLSGDADRGRRIVLDRTSGNCLICHAVPEPSERFMGNLAPSLAGVGSVRTAGQLRLQVVDAARVNPKTIMPPYYRTSGLTRVAPQFAGKTVLSAQEVEDVVAYLASLE